MVLLEGRRDERCRLASVALRSPEVRSRSGRPDPEDAGHAVGRPEPVAVVRVRRHHALGRREGVGRHAPHVEAAVQLGGEGQAATVRMPCRIPVLAVAGHRLAGAPGQVVDVDLFLALLDAAHRDARPVRRQAQGVGVVVGLERQVFATAVARHPGEPGERRSERRISLHEGEHSLAAERDVALAVAHGVEAPDCG